MRVAVNGRSLAVDRAVDLRASDTDHGSPPGPTAVAAAIRGEGAERVTYEGPAPGPVHKHLGVVPAERESGWLRAALAAAARSRGHEAPQRERIAAIEATLSELSPATVDLAGARERVAETGADLQRRRERVAQLQGRVQESDDPALAEELSDAVAALTEAETEHVAAEQALARARESARSARDVRERRLRLQDELQNREREARARLAAEIAPAVRAALPDLPGDGSLAAEPLAVEGDARTVALGILAVADVRAPVVVAGAGFAGAEAAAAALSAPVVRLPPAER